MNRAAQPLERLGEIRRPMQTNGGLERELNVVAIAGLRGKREI
jgi:hypothetical protein